MVNVFLGDRLRVSEMHDGIVRECEFGTANLLDHLAYVRNVDRARVALVSREVRKAVPLAVAVRPFETLE